MPIHRVVTTPVSTLVSLRSRCALLVAFLFGGDAFAQELLGLTDANVLVRFSATLPASAPSAQPIAGLAAGDDLVGIDIRPATGVLYGLASSGNLYTIDPSTAQATQVAVLTQAPSGTRFGVDFNPVADRLRVVSDNGQSLRIDVGTGATTLDGSINPAGPQVVAVGYTNSVAGATTTALYDIDRAGNQLLLQAPPNDGTVSVVGPLGVTIEDGTGMDVLSVGGGNTAYAVLRVAGTTALYTIDLANGAATVVGNLAGNPVIVGLTSSPSPVAGAPALSGTAVGLDAANGLVRFPTASPASAGPVLPVTGLAGGDSLLDIDFRPATGELYALASSGRLYVVDPATGVATPGAQLSVAPNGGVFAIDFNPTVDRLRVVSNTGQNLRVNVATGEAIVDGPINPAAPQVAGAAYTFSAPGATSTGLYVLDAGSDALVLQNPPNAGTLVPIGALGAAFDAPGGFDILSDGATNTAYAALASGGTTTFHVIDLISGAATPVGAVGGNPALRGLAVTSAIIGGPGGPDGDAVPLPLDARWAMLALVTLLMAGGAFTLRRHASTRRG